MARGIDAVKPRVYFVTQAVARGALGEVYDILTESPFEPDEINPATGRVERGPQGIEMIESAKEVTQPEQPLEDPQAMLQGLSVPQVGGDASAFEPLSQGPSAAPTLGQIDPAMSPTILPSDKDRELAMRLRGPLGGIASLA